LTKQELEKLKEDSVKGLALMREEDRKEAAQKKN
jgi:hypothetical protein